MDQPTHHNDQTPPEQRIVASIRTIIRAVDLHSRRLVASCGLTGPQLAVLQTVQHLAPATPSRIAKTVHLSQATITGVLARLEARGLLTRQRSSTDRRSIELRTTPTGDELLDRAPSLLQDRFRDELARLPEWERLMLQASLERVASLMGAESIQEAPHLFPERDIAAAEAVANEPTNAAPSAPRPQPAAPEPQPAV